MIPNQPRRVPHQGTPPFGAQPFHAAPNAALLIDFDNVTMGIRSDLGKELKSLLNSDVIRGKVAVQRAYADWRRYPQYIVPLAESSIDLIFAPAYGSSKKNATDLRMAIDAIELVFTRPEIGTFILMTGDSDFSSCVLKLKEYGKYVIGVGMRESSSDLLIQNCDEYYSYHSLSGLTRAGEVEESREDPWVLLKRAAQQMVANGDVMRTDRLKQVMLDLDPAFDEKKIGYSKFSRFVHEGANKGYIKLRKGENGQYEIALDEEGAAPAAAAPRPETPRAEAPPADGRRRDRDRGRGRDRDRERERPRAEEPRREPEPEAAAAQVPAPITPPQPAPAAPALAPAAEAAAPPVAAAPVGELRDAYRLLQQAVRQLSGGDRRPVRDGDVKRRMIELAPGFDETALGFGKFTRFLRQAHDAEVIDLNRVNNGNYEVSLSASGPRLEPLVSPAQERAAQEQAAAETASAPPAAPGAPARPAEPVQIEQAAPAAPAALPATRPAVAAGALRGRRGGRAGAPEGPPPLLPGQVVARTAAPPVAAETAPATEDTPASAPADAAAGEPAEAPSAEARRGRRGGRRGRGGRAEEASAPAAEERPVETAAAEPQPAPAPEPEAAPAPRAGRGRGRGRGGRGAAEGPPPILPGQAVDLSRVAAAAESAAADAVEAAPGAAEVVADTPVAAGEAPKKRRSRARKSPGAEGAAPAPAPEPEAVLATAPVVTPPAPSQGGTSGGPLKLPRGRKAVEEYLTTSYKGIGAKTAETLWKEFGPELFTTMEREPERIQALLGEKRASGLLAQWNEDFARRSQGAASPAPDAEAPAPAPEAAEAEAPAADSTDEKPKARRGGRGGRGRGGRAKESTPTS